MNTDPLKVEETPFAGPMHDKRVVLTNGALEGMGGKKDQVVGSLPERSGYAHSVTVWISPRVLRWIAPAMAVALFVLLFLPWTGVYPGGYGVCTQNAFQMIWAGVSVDSVHEEALADVKPYDGVEADPLMVFYILLVALALVLVLTPLWLTPARVQALLPVVRSLWPWRLRLLGVVALAAFSLLIVQLCLGFGLETAVVTKVNKNLAEELSAAKTEVEHEKANIHRGLQLGSFSLGRTLWLRLAVLAHVVLVIGLGLELWIYWRGSKPLPRIDGHA
jgi:hypothetical protein